MKLTKIDNIGTLPIIEANANDENIKLYPFVALENEEGLIYSLYVKEDTADENVVLSLNPIEEGYDVNVVFPENNEEIMTQIYDLAIQFSAEMLDAQLDESLADLDEDEDDEPITEDELNKIVE